MVNDLNEQDAKKSGRKGCIQIFVVSCILVGLCISAELSPYFEYKREHKRIKSLVNVGMDIDEARSVLIKNGFTAGPVEIPKGFTDYYRFNVTLLDQPSIILEIIRSMGWAKPDYAMYGGMSSGADKKVRKIY